MINQDQFKEVKERVDAIESYLKIPEKRMELSEQELKTQDPDFWNDPKAAEVQMKKIRGIKVWIQSFDELTELLGDLEVLIEFAKEGEATEEEVQQKYDVLVEKIEELELKNMLSGEEDALVSRESAETIFELVSSTDVCARTAPGGHAGVLAGESAIKAVWKPSAEWLAERD